MSTKILKKFFLLDLKAKTWPVYGYFQIYALFVYEKSPHIYLQERMFIFDCWLMQKRKALLSPTQKEPLGKS